VHNLCFVSLFPIPPKTRNPHHRPVTFCGAQHGALPQDLSSVLKCLIKQEFTWVATMSFQGPYRFSPRGRPPCYELLKGRLPVRFPFTFTSSFHCHKDLPWPVAVFSQAELTKTHGQTLMHPSLEYKVSSLLGDYTRLTIDT
jgi:hypothetical protein